MAPGLPQRGRTRAVAGQARPAGRSTPGRCRQVLADAARELPDARRRHGRVHTRRTGPAVVVEVTDEGAGRARRRSAPRIFERTVSGRDSTGLGLAVARDLAEADGGRLELLQAQPPVFALFLARGGAVATRPEAEPRSGRRHDAGAVPPAGARPRVPARGATGAAGSARAAARSPPACQADSALADGQRRNTQPVGPEAEQRADADADELEDVALQRASQPKP